MSLRGKWTMPEVLLVVVIVLMLASGAWAQGKYKILHRFGVGQDGSALTAGLIFDQAGNLYGTAGYGGTNGVGTVFELIPRSNGGWSEKVLHAFTGGSDGGIPLAALIFDQYGNLYGTTSSGGANGWGTVFKLTHNSNGSWTESVLYSFCSLNNCGDGSVPLGAPIFDQAGNLYGTTARGGGSDCRGPCGTVFKLTPNSDGSWTESVLHSFCSLKGCRDGGTPFAGVIFDQAGNLYGTTNYGGNLGQCKPNGCGVVFQLKPNADGSWTESVLHTFSSINSYWGVHPLDSLLFDQAGNLYGTAEFGGGAAGGGVVFQLTPNADGSWREKVLHSFSGGGDGYAPYASLIFDQAGNLYGTTFEGGLGGVGVVFKLVPSPKGAWRETVLHAFVDRPGALPNAGVIFDAAGNLYGTTYGDSNTTFGSVFEIMP